MAQINSTAFKQWQNGETIPAEKYVEEREIVRIAINDNDKRITDHKSAAVLDHPDGSVTAAKLATNAVTGGKIAPGAVTADKLDATLLTQLTGGTVDISGIQNQVNSNLKLFWGSVE